MLRSIIESATLKASTEIKNGRKVTFTKLIEFGNEEIDNNHLIPISEKNNVKERFEFIITMSFGAGMVK